MGVEMGYVVSVEVLMSPISGGSKIRSMDRYIIDSRPVQATGEGVVTQHCFWWLHVAIDQVVRGQGVFKHYVFVTFLQQFAKNGSNKTISGMQSCCKNLMVFQNCLVFTMILQKLSIFCHLNLFLL